MFITKIKKHFMYTNLKNKIIAQYKKYRILYQNVRIKGQGGSLLLHAVYV